MASEWKWIVLAGGFTGDGSAEHRLFRNENGDRLPLFKSHAAAENFVLMHRLGEHALIAEVIATASPATALDYERTGRRIIITEVGEER